MKVHFPFTNVVITTSLYNVTKGIVAIESGCEVWGAQDRANVNLRIWALSIMILSGSKSIVESVRTRSFKPLVQALGCAAVGTFAVLDLIKYGYAANEVC